MRAAPWDRFVSFIAAAFVGMVAAVVARERREAELVEECYERADDAEAVLRMREARAEWKRDPSIARPYSEIRAELIAGGQLEDRSFEPAL